VKTNSKDLGMKLIRLQKVISFIFLSLPRTAAASLTSRQRDLNPS